jgi:beta-lactamase regulating signal transducer with metallopeptidase domain
MFTDWLLALISNALTALLLASAALVAAYGLKRPALAHALWCLALLKLLTPPCWTVPIPGVSLGGGCRSGLPPTGPGEEAGTEAQRGCSTQNGWPEGQGARVVGQSALQRSQPETPSHGSIPALQQPGPGASFFLPSAQALVASDEFVSVELPEGSGGSGGGMNPVGPSPSTPRAGEDRASQTPSFLDRPVGNLAVSELLFGVWLFGAVVWVARCGAWLASVRRLIRASFSPSPELAGRLEELAVRFGLKRVPQLWLVPGCASPCVVAPLRRAGVLVPLDVFGQLDREEQDALLAHELAHLRRGDHLVRWLELGATAVYWWCPVVWLARRELRRLEDYCCDAWVLHVLPGARGAYARALLAVTTAVSSRVSSATVALPATSTFKALERRFQMLRQGHVGWIVGCGGRLLIAFCACLTAPWAFSLSLAQAESGSSTQAASTGLDEGVPLSLGEAPFSDDLEWMLDDAAGVQAYLAEAERQRLSSEEMQAALGTAAEAEQLSVEVEVVAPAPTQVRQVEEKSASAGSAPSAPAWEERLRKLRTEVTALEEQVRQLQANLEKLLLHLQRVHAQLAQARAAAGMSPAETPAGLHPGGPDIGGVGAGGLTTVAGAAGVSPVPPGIPQAAVCYPGAPGGPVPHREDLPLSANVFPMPATVVGAIFRVSREQYQPVLPWLEAVGKRLGEGAADGKPRAPAVRWEEREQGLEVLGPPQVLSAVKQMLEVLVGEPVEMLWLSVEPMVPARPLPPAAPPQPGASRR